LFKLKKKKQNEVGIGLRCLAVLKVLRCSKGSKSTRKVFIETRGSFRTVPTC